MPSTRRSRSGLRDAHAETLDWIVLRARGDPSASGAGRRFPHFDRPLRSQTVPGALLEDRVFSFSAFLTSASHLDFLLLRFQIRQLGLLLGDFGVELFEPALQLLGGCHSESSLSRKNGMGAKAWRTARQALCNRAGPPLWWRCYSKAGLEKRVLCPDSAKNCPFFAPADLEVCRHSWDRSSRNCYSDRWWGRTPWGFLDTSDKDLAVDAFLLSLISLLFHQRAAALAVLPEPARRWFEQHIGTPTAAQRLAWPTVAGAKRNLLLCAPTGSGKTLAAFLPILGVLATGPLRSRRALSLPRSAEGPGQRCPQEPPRPISEVSVNSFLPGCGQVRVGLRTGDTSAVLRGQPRRRPPPEILPRPPPRVWPCCSARPGRRRCSPVCAG